MDIRQLRYFIAIVEEGKISAAADRLHISQPPLSQQLKNMEEELDSQLIIRTGKRFEVTEAGKSLYAYALQVTQLMEEAEMEVKSVGNGANGTLSLGINTLSLAELPGLLQKFHIQYPKVYIKIKQNESTYLCKLVRDRVVELAIVRLPLEIGDLSIIHLMEEPFYFITSEQCEPLQTEVSLHKIKDYPLFLPSKEGMGIHYLILEGFSRLEVKPNIIGECSDISTLLDLVSSGLGASIVPETVLKRYQGKPIRSYRLAKPNNLLAPIGLVWLKNHYLSKTAQHFVDMVRKEFC
ncbi:LysR family transcriptional regulator [Sporosarcina sp. Te-1]|uniref:LysR family transcriptional regulator n=1 Tax=Sporosarcina sp. Te-1 TaxID=2818390 RepID=UPI001A9CC5B7|nr:LysR family transcriptional regulator [Sporosarcina sp. Te-1]QTD43085.1 LysR family transcriptional regulator [Sporosarcina sp. Te-1]